MTGKYRGQVLDGYNTFPRWKVDVDLDFSNKKTRRVVDGFAIRPKELTMDQIRGSINLAVTLLTDYEPSAADEARYEARVKKIEDHDTLFASAMITLQQSVNESIKLNIQAMGTPKEIYDYLVKRYSAGNPAHIQSLITEINSVPTLKNTTVAEKV